MAQYTWNRPRGCHERAASAPFRVPLRLCREYCGTPPAGPEAKHISQMDLRLDRSLDRPLYEQIAGQFEEMIAKGLLAPGAKLPASRSLARSLGVQRNTVVEAYRVLLRRGLVRAKQGSGTYVSVPSPAVSAKPPSTTRPPAADSILQRLLRLGLEEVGGEDAWHLPRGVPEAPIQLTGAVADRSLFPIEAFSACLKEVLDEKDPAAFDYGPPEGYLPLREWIAAWMESMGVSGVRPENVFIVSGSQQGLDLVIRLFVEPGDVVAIEAPTYAGAFLGLKAAGARVVTVPVDEQGMDTEELAAVLRSASVKMVYTMPCFQNPTGVTMSPQRRQKLLRLAREHRFLVVEDHFDTDLSYWGDRAAPLLAQGLENPVIYLGTFSKILFPGLRLGWMVVPAGIVGHLRTLRLATDLTSATLAQKALYRFCASGGLAEHLETLRRVTGDRLRSMLVEMERRFPPEVSWSKPNGGMTLWVNLPDSVDSDEMFVAAARRGVLFSPGRLFYPAGGGRNGMRLSFNREPEQRIRKGIGILAELIAARIGKGVEHKSEGTGQMPFI